MSGLAAYLLKIGKSVGGSDITDSEYIRELHDLGVKVDLDGNTESIKNYEVVVYTDAIMDNDAYLETARKNQKVLISRGHLLYEVSCNFENVIAVSGCHGKTTCVSMLAHIFSASDKAFAAQIGGRDSKFKNFCYFGDDYFITEACEYKKNFLLLKPNIAVILNSNADHLECYGSEEALKSAYLQFGGSAKTCVSLYCDLPVAGVSFGFDNSADYFAKNIKNNSGKYSFEIYERGTELGSVNLSIYGKHNVLNALAACGAAREAGLPFETIKKGLEDFSGVERRFENIGRYNGAECIADYAHHPDELRATLRTVNKLTDKRIFVIFQPHTYSRTKNLFKDFVKVLSPVNNLLIYRTFAAREYFDDAGSALTLSQNIKKSRYGDVADDIVDFISDAKAGDIILFLGAGDIYYLANQLIKGK